MNFYKLFGQIGKHFPDAKRTIVRMFLALVGIAQLNTTDGCIIESDSEIGEMQNKLIISDRTASQEIVKDKRTRIEIR